MQRQHKLRYLLVSLELLEIDKLQYNIDTKRTDASGGNSPMLIIIRAIVVHDSRVGDGYGRLGEKRKKMLP